MKLTVEDLIELADMDTCNEDGVFDYIEFGSIVQDTVLGIDLEETSFQTQKAKEMKGKYNISDEKIKEIWLKTPTTEKGGTILDFAKALLDEANKIN